MDKLIAIFLLLVSTVYSVASVTSAPHLVVRATDGRPCLIATLNATMTVSYRVPEVIVHETYWASADIQLPRDVVASGVCGDDVTNMTLTWANGTFEMVLNFTKKAPALEGRNATWFLKDIEVYYDLSMKNVFPGASEDDHVIVARRDLHLFHAPMGVAYQCDRDVTTQLGGNERGVVVKFHSLKMAAFGVTNDEFPVESVKCSPGSAARVPDNVLVPTVIAGCLVGVVIIVVIAYVITGKLQKAREQQEYRPMS